MIIPVAEYTGVQLTCIFCHSHRIQTQQGKTMTETLRRVICRCRHCHKRFILYQTIPQLS